MPIVRGTTPTITAFISKEEVSSLSLVNHIYLTFRQKGSIVSSLSQDYYATNDEWPDEVEELDTAIQISFTLTQTQSLGLEPDEDLTCIMDVTFIEQVSDGTNTERKRITSKPYKIAVCDADRDEVLS